MPYDRINIGSAKEYQELQSKFSGDVAIIFFVTFHSHLHSNSFKLMMMNTLLKENSKIKLTDAVHTSNKETTRLQEEEKVNQIQFHFSKIMETLGLNLDADGLYDTSSRIANFYVKEAFNGLDHDNRPKITPFPNDSGYRRMLVHKDIPVYTFCKHYFLPITGRLYLAYLPEKNMIDLRDLHHLVRYYAHRPQTQERLTVQIADGVKKVLNHDNVAVMIKAMHFSVTDQDVWHTNNRSVTAEYSGRFLDDAVRHEFVIQIEEK